MTQPVPPQRGAIPGEKRRLTTSLSRFLTSVEWRWAAHVYAALALAVAAPMFGRLEQHVHYLLAQDLVTVGLVIMVLSVLLPGIAIALIAAIKRWCPRYSLLSIQTVIGVCGMLIVLGLVSQRVIMGTGILVVVTSAAIGIGLSMAYRRWELLRILLTTIGAMSMFFPLSVLWIYHRNASPAPRIEVTQTVKNPVPVVMVVFDCFCGVHLMDDKRQIDPDRYPRFAELAQSANWYRNCSAIHPRTDRAVPAILTGLLPKTASKGNVEVYPQSLFSLLAATGKYQTTSFEPFTHVCPSDGERYRSRPDVWTQWINVLHALGAVYVYDHVPRDLGIDTPRIPRTILGLSHDMAVDRSRRRGLIQYGWDTNRHGQFAHFLDCIDDSDSPNLWFGHFALPHYPWNYLPSGHLYARDIGVVQIWGATEETGETWSDDEQAVMQANQQHLLQLQYTDRLIGQLIDHLRKQNLFDRCLLVIVADHGISFRHGMSGRLPTSENPVDIMSVPLFIKLPHQTAGEAIDLSVETTDVLPTILEVLGLTAPASMDGQSIISDEFTERPQKQFFTDTQRFEVDAQFEGRNQLLADQLARFGSGTDPVRLFKIGPHPQLLGKSLDKIDITEPSSIVIRPLTFDGIVRIPAAFVPAHLQALVEWNGQPQPAKFAIAVNDTVWGTTQSYAVRNLKDHWSVMLPESVYHDGPNTIRVFQIVDGSPAVQLRECKIGMPTSVEPRLP